MAKDPTRRSLHFFVPVSFHRRLKMVCAYEERTQRSYILEALEIALKKSEKAITSVGAAEASSSASARVTNG